MSRFNYLCDEYKRLKFIQIINNSAKVLKKMFINMCLTRAVYIETAQSDLQNKVLCFFPNYFVSDDTIYENAKLPKKSNLECFSKYDDRLSLINNFLSNTKQTVGMFYVFKITKDKEYKLFSSCTFSIINFGEKKIKGVARLHVLPEDNRGLKFFIDFSEQTRNFTKIVPLIPKSLTEVQVDHDQFSVRKKIIEETQDVEEKLFHTKNFGDTKIHLHCYPSLDVLFFDMPKDFNGNYLELERNFPLKEDSFCFYVGYNSDSSKLGLKDEYKYSTPIHSVHFTPKDLVYMNNKSVGIGEVEDYSEGKFLSNTFTGASGSPLINSNDKVIGFSGLSFYDNQQDQELKNYSFTEPHNIHYFENEKCNEVVADGSYNFNLFISIRNVAFIQYVNEIVFGFKNVSVLQLKGDFNDNINEELDEIIKKYKAFKIQLKGEDFGKPLFIFLLYIAHIFFNNLVSGFAFFDSFNKESPPGTESNIISEGTFTNFQINFIYFSEIPAHILQDVHKLYNQLIN